MLAIPENITESQQIVKWVFGFKKHLFLLIIETLEALISYSSKILQNEWANQL